MDGLYCGCLNLWLLTLLNHHYTWCLVKVKSKILKSFVGKTNRCYLGTVHYLYLGVGTEEKRKTL